MKINYIIPLFCLLAFSLLCIDTYAQDKEFPQYSNKDTGGLVNAIESARKLSHSEPDSAFTLLTALLDQSMKFSSRKGTKKALVYMARIDVMRGRYARALEKYASVLKYCDTLTDREQISEVYNSIGSIYNSQAKFEHALQAFYKAIYYHHSIEYYNNLANVLAQLKQYDKAFTYLNKAIPYAEKNKKYRLWSMLLINKGMIYYDKKDYAKAKLYTNAGIMIAAENQLYREQNSGLLNAGLIYMATNQPYKALETLHKAFNLYKKPGMTAKEQNETISILGDVYLQLKDYKAAEKHFQLAWQNADIMPKERLFILQKLSDLYFRTDRLGEAYATLKHYTALKDTLQSKEIALSVSEMETKYRTAEKDKVIISNELQLAQQKKRLATKNIWIIGIAAGSILVFVFMTWRYSYIRQKNKRLKSEHEIGRLKAIMEGEEKERSRLAHDLHDSVSSQLAATKSYLLAMEQSYPVLAESDYFHKVRYMLNNMTAEVRQIAHNLAPDDLLRKGLPQVVHEFCDSIFLGKQVQSEIQVYGDYKDVDTRLSLAIYRIIQELLHNVVKHAEATEVILVLIRTPDQISLTVEDNGTGIPEETLDLKGSGGIGLSGLRERVKALNGNLFIEKGKGKGTLVNIVFYLDTHAIKEVTVS